MSLYKFKLINEDEQEVDPESDADKNKFILLKCLN